jgi:quercetin dioxygenase-like cupin family protein
MEIAKTTDIAKRDMTNEPLFEGGKVFAQMGLFKDSPKVLSVGVITFEKGGMTKMHTHDHEQVIYCIGGKGRVVTEKEDKIIGPGTFVFFSPGENHAHGAPKDSQFVQMTITNMGSGAKYQISK